MRVRWLWLAVLAETALWSAPIACFWALWRLMYGRMPADIVAVDVFNQHLQFPRGIAWWWSGAFIVLAIAAIVANRIGIEGKWESRNVPEGYYKLHEAAPGAAVYAMVSVVAACLARTFGFVAYPVSCAVLVVMSAMSQKMPSDWKLRTDEDQPHGENITIFGVTGIAVGIIFALIPATLVAVHDSIVLGVGIVVVSALAGAVIALIIAQPIYWLRFWYWKRYTAPKLRAQRAEFEQRLGEDGMNRLRRGAEEAMRRINENDPIVDEHGNPVVD